MKKLPQISEAEYEVMKVIWKYAPINTNEITDKLLQCTDWSPKTIHTLIKRLAEKAPSHMKNKVGYLCIHPLSKNGIISNRKAILF